MKKSLLLLVSSVLMMSNSFAQVTVSSSNCTVGVSPARDIDGTYLNFGPANGKNGFINTVTGAIISYSGTEWAISISNVNHYTNTNDVGVNPPATGWVAGGGGGCTGAGTPVLSGDVGAVMPVELTSFEAKKEVSVAVLNWQTATEENNEKFEIEVSHDGTTFTKIGEVEGHGTTQEVQNYEFIDAQPKAGVNYYRLKQLDYNGVFDYSDIVSVDFTATTLEPISIFPNPVKSQLNIINGEGQATIYNILGQPVKQFAVGSEQFAVNTDDLAEGQYVLRIIQNGGTVVTKQFTK